VVQPDDCSLSAKQHSRIRKQAKLALQKADALGVFPTPVDDVMAAAELLVASEDLADESLLNQLRRQAGKTVRRALKKLLGVVHVVSRIVYLDKAVHIAKLPFLKLHETAHAVLPWQKDLYAVTEDCEMTIAPEVAEEFEMEANLFATEVMFQLDSFTEESAEQAFNILVPVRLSKQYGASVYSSIRRYVSIHPRACMVLVLEKPEIHSDLGFSCKIRRTLSSTSFQKQFGELSWPPYFSPSDEIGAAIPVNGKRMSGRRRITLIDQNGNKNQCLAEAFTNTYQVFILIHSVKTLSATSVSVA